MDITLNFKPLLSIKPEILLISAFKKEKEGAKKSQLVIDHWPKAIQASWKKVKASGHFSGDLGKMASFTHSNGSTIIVVGLGNKNKITSEKIRQTLGTVYSHLKKDHHQIIEVDADSFNLFDCTRTTIKILTEAFMLTHYSFTKYLSEKKNLIKKVIFTSSSKQKKEVQEAFSKAHEICEGIFFARNLINEVPNVLNSEELARQIVEDAKKNLRNIKISVLDKKQIVKEKMNLLLSVNKGSAFEPRLVHITYVPEKATKETKHIALVGKGLTYDSGGYNIKSSMVGMKMDMAGAATVYAAFRNAVRLHADCKISCFLGITDNMISPIANVADSIIVGRSGTSVEILNTDAEGRLVLADVLDYACDFRPDYIIDAATLTGACVRALWHVCGVMGNDDQLIQEVLTQAKAADERAWQLPIFDEYRDDIKSTLADIKNLSGTPEAGAQKAAAFLETFVKKSIPWVHLDIAGVDTAPHLSYCPKGSASGLMIRTLTGLLLDDRWGQN